MMEAILDSYTGTPPALVPLEITEDTMTKVGL